VSFTWEHVLYRLRDSSGDLLYVGVTNSIPARFAHHASRKPWWSEVADCQVTFYPDRTSLMQAEDAAIRSESPRYNIQKNGGRPLPVWMDRYGAVKTGPGPLAPCLPDGPEPWAGCTCRSVAEHYGWPA
jgi:predicted GIY-YIG superfamily endonuclease